MFQTTHHSSSGASCWTVLAVAAVLAGLLGSTISPMAAISCGVLALVAVGVDLSPRSGSTGQEDGR